MMVHFTKLQVGVVGVRHLANDYRNFDERLDRNRLPRCYTAYLRFLCVQRSKMTEEQLKEFDAAPKDGQ